MKNALCRLTALTLVLLLAILAFIHSQAQAATHLQNRFDQLSSSVAGATTTHLFGFDITDLATPLGSIEFQFCSNDPLPSLPCTAPTGLDTSGAVLAGQTGNTGFSVAAGSSNNEIILTRSASLPSAGANTYQLNNVVNPTTADTFYIRAYTFASTDASGADTQDGGIAEAINSTLNVNAEVPPFLKFCAGATITDFDCATAVTFFVDLGNFSVKQPSAGSSQFVAATNAQSGYSVTVSGTTLTSGNNTIPALATPTASQAGNSQFGMNLRANANPAVGLEPIGPGIANIGSRYNIPDEFTYVSGNMLVSSPTSSDNQKFTVSYLTNVNASQPIGIYASTFTYICLANF